MGRRRLSCQYIKWAEPICGSSICNFPISCYSRRICRNRRASPYLPHSRSLIAESGKRFKVTSQSSAVWIAVLEGFVMGYVLHLYDYIGRDHFGVTGFAGCLPLSIMGSCGRLVIIPGGRRANGGRHREQNDGREQNRRKFHGAFFHVVLLFFTPSPQYLFVLCIPFYDILI